MVSVDMQFQVVIFVLNSTWNQNPSLLLTLICLIWLFDFKTVDSTRRMVQRYDILSWLCLHGCCCYSSSLWGFTAFKHQQCLEVADAATDAAFLESGSRNAGRKIRSFYRKMKILSLFAHPHDLLYPYTAKGERIFTAANNKQKHQKRTLKLLVFRWIKPLKG